jgi:hypothetical protein
MIERYAIKFGPAVSQKELEKKLNEITNPDELKELRKMKARIEFVGDIEDIHKLTQMLRSLAPKVDLR